MLEAVAFIGQMLGKEEEMVAGLTQDVRKPPKVDRLHLVILDFQVKDGKAGLEADIFEIPDDYEARIAFLSKWRWVGNASGYNPQLFLTTDKVSYLISPDNPCKFALGELQAELARRGLHDTSLYRSASTIVSKCFRRLPGGLCVLDPERLGLVPPGTLDDEWKKAPGPRDEDRSKILQKWISKEITDAILKRVGIGRKEAGLWTLSLNGQPLVHDPVYDEVVLGYKLAGFEDATIEGVCSVCGNRETVSYEAFKRLDFLKYYITDKIGFASGITGNGFARNFLVCKSCFESLMVAERFVRQNMSLRVGILDFLVLPHFALPPRPDEAREELSEWVEATRRRVSSLVSTASWIRSLSGTRDSLEEALQDFLQELPYDNQALLNFLFYQKSQSELKILSLIKDVAPSRISHLLQQSHRLANRIGPQLGLEKDDSWLDLTKIYQLIPLNTGTRVEHRKILYLYEGILKGQKISYEFLIREFVELAKIYAFKHFRGTNVSEPPQGFEELTMATRLLRAGILLKFLREENLLQGVRDLPEVKVCTPGQIDHRFRLNSITDSGGSRSLIPEQADHRFREHSDHFC